MNFPRVILLSRAVVFLLSAHCAMGFAAEAAKPLSPPAESALTAEAIQAIREQGGASGDLSGEQKENLDKVCQQALDGLARVKDLRAAADTHRKEADRVQERVATLKKKLSDLQREPAPLPEGMSLAELEQEASKREVDLAKLKAALTKVEAEAGNRQSRRREIREALLQANGRLEEADKLIAALGQSAEPPVLVEAMRAELLVRRQLIVTEQPCLENELARYDAEEAADCLRLERDLLAQEVAQADAGLKQLQILLDRRRKEVAADAVQQARETRDQTSASLRAHAEENIALSEVAQGLNRPIEQTRRDLETTKSRLEEVRKQYSVTSKRVDEIGLTGSIGSLLRRQKAGLPDVRRREGNVRQRKSLIEQTQYAQMEYDDLRTESISIKSAVRRILADATAESGEDAEALEAEAQAIAERRRDNLDQILRNYKTYLDTLFDLDANEQQLIRETEVYRAYIDERVLWIRSHRPLFSALATEKASDWQPDLSEWQSLAGLLLSDAKSNAFWYFVFALAFLLLMQRKGRLVRELKELGEAASRGSCTEYAHTLRAGLLTLIITAPWPGLACFFGWRFLELAGDSPIASRLGQGLVAAASIYFLFELLRRVSRPNGLGEAHFEWNNSTLRFLRRHTRWAAYVGAVVTLLTFLTNEQDLKTFSGLAERLLFILGMAATTAFFLWKALHPRTGAWCDALAARRGGLAGPA